MCLCVVVVSPFRLCHITRVYVGFSFLSVIYTVSLCPLKAVWVLCLCRFVGLLLIFFKPSTVFFFYLSTPRRPLPWQSTARAAKIMSRETNLFYRCAMSLHSDRVKTCSSSLNQTEMTYRDRSRCEMLIFPRPKVSGVSGAIWVKG